MTIATEDLQKLGEHGIIIATCMLEVCNEMELGYHDRVLLLIKETLYKYINVATWKCGDTEMPRVVSSDTAWLVG